MTENELVGKQHEFEELNRELEEMRASYGTEGLQQVCLPYVVSVTHKNKNRKFELQYMYMF